MGLNAPLLGPGGSPPPASYSAIQNPSALTSTSTLCPDSECQNASDERKCGGVRAFLFQEISAERANLPMAAYCFMTGYIDILSFSTVFIWCGFQTGNTSQLAIALARLFQDQPAARFTLADKLALTSVCAFLCGAFLGRIGDTRWIGGAKSRAWLVLGTGMQTLMTVAAALAINASAQPSVSSARSEPVWAHPGGYACIVFMSMSLGLQGVMGSRVNTHYATTVVLTGIWCDLMADPKLFRRGLVKTRDHKLTAIFALLMGAFVGRTVVQVLGAAGSIGLGAAIRALITLSWLLVPSKTDPIHAHDTKPSSA